MTLNKVVAGNAARRCAKSNRISRHALGFLFLLWATQTSAIQSCYDQVHATRDRPVPERILYVLIDQTTPWTSREVQQISGLVSNWPRPGDMIRVLTFSAVSEDRIQGEGRGQDIVEEFVVQSDALPSEDVQDRWRSSQVRTFRACFPNQILKVKIAIKYKMPSIFEKTDKNIGKSEILQSLHRFATTRLRQAADPGKVTVLIASDFLENSNVMSFYRDAETVVVDDDVALAYADQLGLIPNFQGASVFGIGLGVGSHVHKSFRKVHSIVSFWEKYFAQGNAKLIELGRPTLQRERLD